MFRLPVRLPMALSGCLRLVGLLDSGVPSASSRRFVRVATERQHVAHKPRDFVEELATSEQLEIIVVGAADQHKALRFLGCVEQSAALVLGDDAVLIAGDN